VHLSLNLVSKYISYLLSLIGHPLLIVVYVLFLYRKVNPYLFSFAQSPHRDPIILFIIFTVIVFPIVTILLMNGLDFVDSLSLKDKKERIGPLIATIVCYIWLYLNIRTHDAIPIDYSNFILGAIIALSLAFMINLFSKISLHGVGLGGLLFAVIRLLLIHGQGVINFGLGANSLSISSVMIVALLLIFSGAVLTSRLKLGAHTNQEIAGGFIVGVFSQIIANMIS